MSVDERRDTFHVNRVSVSDLDERLIAQSYRPDVIAAVAALRSKGASPLSSALSGRITQGRTPEYGADGDACLKTRNVVGGLVDTTDVDRVSRAFALQNANSRIGPETVLMNRSGAGSIGRVSIYLGKEAVFTNEELFRFCIISPHDPAYIAIFFATSLGERVLERGVNGSTGQLKLVQEHVENVPVLLPDPSAQHYVGDKVRQAERLRRRAARLQAEIDALSLPETISSALAAHESKFNRLVASELDARLDGKYYGRRAMAVLKACLGAGSACIGDLEPKVSNGFEYSDFSETGRPYITVTEVSSGRLDITNAPRIPLDARVPLKATVNERCTFVVRTGSVGIAVKAHREDSHACISSHLIRLEFDNEAQSSAVTAWLNSAAGKCLQEKITYGGVQPQISQDDLLALPVPQVILDAADRILALWEAREQCFRASRRLVSAAKALVEALIERRIEESDLIVAQQAIEKGDHTADHELLARLTAAGLDVPHAPRLFTDLSTLHQTIEAAKASPPLEAK